MCQEIRSNYLFAIKHIFKQKSLLAPLYSSIQDTLKFLMDLDHPNVATLYKFIEDKNKISVFQEYLPTLLYDELMSKKKIPI